MLSLHSSDTLNFGSYGRPKPLREEYRLLIHHRINLNAARSRSGESTWLKLQASNKATRQLTRQHIKIQVWFFKNNTAFFTRWRRNRKKLATPKQLPDHMFVAD